MGVHLKKQIVLVAMISGGKRNMALPSTYENLSFAKDQNSGVKNIVEDGKTIYDGQPVAVATKDYTTSAAVGYFTNHVRAAGLKYAGRFTIAAADPQYKSNGEVYTDRRVGSGTTVRANSLRTPFQHTIKAVANSSAVTDAGEYVWLLEDGTWTLTPPDIDTGFSSIPDGEILQWISGTTCIFLVPWSVPSASVAPAVETFVPPRLILRSIVPPEPTRSVSSFTKASTNRA